MSDWENKPAMGKLLQLVAETHVTYITLFPAWFTLHQFFVAVNSGFHVVQFKRSTTSFRQLIAGLDQWTAHIQLFLPRGQRRQQLRFFTFSLAGLYKSIYFMNKPFNCVIKVNLLILVLPSSLVHRPCLRLSTYLHHKTRSSCLFFYEQTSKV